MEELKPCPFCGSKNVEFRPGVLFNGAIHCNDCSADVVFDACKLLVNADQDWKTAIANGWNRRITDGRNT